jgi:hypothetical protein
MLKEREKHPSGCRAGVRTDSKATAEVRALAHLVETRLWSDCSRGYSRISRASVFTPESATDGLRTGSH